ncbi:hypothetical protein [Thioalkalivibrio sp. ALE16]|uniref:hypothetical protein n=1 Tax=Thioalkalivibrio sp. ALE16 TaxID=1158172 RepID=UPI0004782D77|nr:hypothetical protein [Thioalkalivibrio sp. ALE16]
MQSHNEYVRQLERLWDLVSDAVEAGQIAAPEDPDDRNDHAALVAQMERCQGAKAGLEHSTLYVVASGNPFDGLTFVGPFDDPNAAGDYAGESNLSRDTWQVVPLTAPGQE